MRGVCRLLPILVIAHMLLPFIDAPANAGERLQGKEAETLPRFATASHGSLPNVTEQNVAVKHIPPLYTEPKMPGEGVWAKEDLSGGHDAAPVIYRTFYRPSAEFPNAIVYMLLSI